MDQLKRRATARRRRARGFTLLEVMITMSVMAIGLLAMLMLQIQALRDGSKGRHRTGAAMIARDQLELIQNMAFSNSDLDVMDPLNWATPPWLGNGGDPTLDPGEIPVQVRQDSGTVREIIYTVWYLVDADASGNNNLRELDVEVVWTEENTANNFPTRTGQPTVALSTVIVDNDR